MARSQSKTSGFKAKKRGNGRVRTGGDHAAHPLASLFGPIVVSGNRKHRQVQQQQGNSNGANNTVKTKKKQTASQRGKYAKHQQQQRSPPFAQQSSFPRKAKPHLTYPRNKNTKHDIPPKKKKVPEQLQLPRKPDPGETPPWSKPPYSSVRCETNTLSASQSSKKRRDARLPTHDVQQEILGRLDDEICALASYVRLTEIETARRQQVVTAVQHHAQKAFGEEASLKVFGSFATHAVCCFTSDVDVALQGAGVDTPPRIYDLRSKRPPPQSPTEVAAKRRRALKDRWLDAISDQDNTQDAVDAKPAASSLLTTGAVVSVESSSMTSLPPAESIPPVDPPPPLFVIDRVGDETAESGFSQKETAVGAASAAELRVNESGAAASATLSGEAPIDASTAANGTTSLTREVPTDESAASVIGVVVSKQSAIEASAATDDAKPATPVFGVVFSKQSAVEARAATNGNSRDEDDNSTQDSADKLEGLGAASGVARALASRRDNAIPLSSDTDSDEEEDREAFVAADSDDEDDGNMELGIVAHRPPAAHARLGPIGPTGLARRRVIDALQDLRKRIRRLPCVDKACLINARVPIVKVETLVGFEMDIAVDGHSGTDTSLFAANCTERYESFAPVVMALKVLLNQQNLDAPFTGGLGSYKLYVLVAGHLERHLALGGTDRPSEVLLSLFFRYGSVHGHNVHPDCRSLLDRQVPFTIGPDAASADLSNVYSLDRCVMLFRRCWERLWVAVQSPAKYHLHNIIFADKLKTARENIKKLGDLSTKTRSKRLYDPIIYRKGMKKLTLPPRDRTADQLIAGYSQKSPPAKREQR